MVNKTIRYKNADKIEAADSDECIDFGSPMYLAPYHDSYNYGNETPNKPK